MDDSLAPLPDGYVAHLDQLVADGRKGDAMEYALTTAVGLPQEVVAQMRAEPFFALMEAVAHTAAYDGAIMADTMIGKPLPGGASAGVRDVGSPDASAGSIPVSPGP